MEISLIMYRDCCFFYFKFFIEINTNTLNSIDKNENR